MYIAMQFLKWFCFKTQITITVADRITEIHPATNLLSSQSTFLQEGSSKFYIKKKITISKEKVKSKKVHIKRKKQHWFHL